MPATRTATAGDGCRIAYDVTPGATTARALLLVHGITENRHTWDPLTARLAQCATVVRVDLRGHGESDRSGPYDAVTMARDLHQVVRELGLANVDLIGHSLGGVVVTAYAGAFACGRVINVDQALALAEFRSQLQAIEPQLRGSGFVATMSQLFEALSGPLGEAERSRIGALRSPERDVVLGVWSPLLDAPLAELDAAVEQTLGGVSVPYLALHGDDPGPEYEGWLRELIPTARFELWKESGHYPHLLHPERFVARVREFLDL